MVPSSKPWTEFSFLGHSYRCAVISPIGDKEIVAFRGGVTIQSLHYHRWITKSICLTGEVDKALEALGISK